MVEIKRSEKWRNDYRGERYLKNISDQSLMDRFFGHLRNLAFLDSNGKISVMEPDEIGKIFWRKYTHILEELKIRGHGEEIFKKYTVSDCDYNLNPTHPDPPLGSGLFEETDISDKAYLFKYGDQNYMNRLLKNGELRLGTASDFGEDRYNSARQDPELEITTISSKEKLNIFYRNEDGEKIEIPLESDVMMTKSISYDYYLYCLTTSYRCRHYEDFCADSCVIIEEPTEFIRRVVDGVRNKINGYAPVAGVVKYFDPYFAILEELPVPFSKHYRYLYQREFRIVWIPINESRMSQQLEPRNSLTIGSIEDIASIYSGR